MPFKNTFSVKNKFILGLLIMLFIGVTSALVVVSIQRNHRLTDSNIPADSEDSGLKQVASVVSVPINDEETGQSPEQSNEQTTVDENNPPQQSGGGDETTTDNTQNGSTPNSSEGNQTPTPPEQTPAPSVSGLGPAGRWPTGFPPYSSTATVVTNGTVQGLTQAINQLASSGGVIEHAGNLTDVILDRSGSAPIVIRPPLGQRANYTVSSSRIYGSGMLLAGWRLAGSFRVHNATNSGVAWMEGDDNLWFETAASSAGNTAHGLMYELVVRGYRNSGDRSRLWSNGAGSYAEMDVVGSWLTGSTAAPPAHADTIQAFFQSGATGVVNISNSVIWPSWDKALQGGNEANNNFVIDSSWIAEPSAGESIFPGGGIVLDGYHAITAVASITNSTLLGSVHNGYPVTISGSTLYNVSGIVDGGGNTVVTEVPHPPAALTHTQLDSVWHN